MLQVDRDNIDFYIGTKSAAEYNQQVMNMSTAEIKELYKDDFKNPDVPDEVTAEKIRRTARSLDRLFQKDKDTAESYMENVRGNNNFYNIKANLAISGLKFLKVFGCEVDDMIDIIDASASLANEQSYSEERKILSNFIKNHATDVALIIAGLITGGTGYAATAVNILTKTIGYTGEAYKLIKKYEKLASDPEYQKDSAALNRALMAEVAKNCAYKQVTKVEKHGVSTAGEAINIPINSNTASGMVKAGNLLGTGVQEARNHSQAKQ